jgi:carbon storage regulator
MLVLSRKSGEELVIPQHGIVMTVLQIRGNQVRLGISAPVEVDVHRGELWKRIQSQLLAKEAPAANGM